jgi:5-hydroxyisourate hydrolase-like protein (transthyretin family)
MANQPNSNKIWSRRFFGHVRAVLVLVSFLSTSSLLTAQHKDVLTVRVIDMKTGRPVANREILAERIDPRTHMPLVEPGLPLKALTNSEGRATFDASLLSTVQMQRPGHQQMTKTLDVEVIYAAGGFQCSKGLLSLEEVLRTGVIDDAGCNLKFDRSKLTVIPGEVTLIVGKYHWWQAGQT